MSPPPERSAHHDVPAPVVLIHVEEAPPSEVADVDHEAAKALLATSAISQAPTKNIFFIHMRAFIHITDI